MEQCEERVSNGESKARNTSITERFRNLFSTDKIPRSSSSQMLKSVEQRKLTRDLSKDYISARESSLSKSALSKSSTTLNNSSILKLKKDVYVSSYKIEVVICYSLTNGMIGTYEPNYKLLFSKKQKYSPHHLASTSRSSTTWSRRCLQTRPLSTSTTARSIF